MSLYIGSQKIAPAILVKGGGETSNIKKDVNFYDYDGTIVDSYTASEFANLTAMPDNPTHEGLTSQGWNWSLSDAKTYVADYGKLDVGQMYITDDGKTRIYIKLEEGRLSPYLGFAVDGTVTVEWGDGISQDVTGTSTSTTIYTQHTYTQAGEYVIKLSSSSDIYLQGNNSKGSFVLSKNSNSINENAVYLNTIKKIELGSTINIGNHAFNSCYSLSSITIPMSITSINNYAFYNCYSLLSIIIPNNITYIGSAAFWACYSLSKASIPNSVTNIGNSVFRNCFILSSTIITKMDTYWFTNCYSLSSVTISNNVTSISSSAFLSCYSLSSITIPDSVTSIGSSAFQYCYGMAYYDFSNHTSVPTLIGASAFSGIPSDCQIIVPDNLYEDWIVATNWSTYADYIVKASEV